MSFGNLLSATFGGIKGNRDWTLTNSASNSVSLSVGYNNQSTAYSGALSGKGAIHKLGTGTLTLSGMNTYTGNTAILQGTLQAKGPTALSGYGTAGKVLVFNGAMLTVNTGGPGEWAAGDIQTLLSKSNFNSGSLLGVDTTDALGENFDYPTALAGNIGLSKLGSG